jgi:DNA-binding NtrC family response regulator
MPTSQLALVVDDDCLGRAIQCHLEEHLDRPAPRYRFDTVREHLGPHRPAHLVCAPTSPADTRAVARLVQNVRLQQWPSTILVLEPPGLAPDESLGRLDSFIDCRLSWPDEAPLLTGLLHYHRLTHKANGRERPGRGRAAPAAGKDAEAEVLSRELLHQTPSLAAMAQALGLAAAHDVTVLLTGETGTGKTYLAHLIHRHSPRRAERFLVVPCGALSPGLIESEFFGHVRGAFTGADRAKAGKFEAVGNGTLLLDEVDALGLEQQAKLLRVIETGEYEPVGSNETRRCTARIIATSNRNMEQAVEKGRFRQDLYYRLNVLAFHLPPLRERRQDVGPLVRTMAARFSGKFRRDLFAISPEAQEFLEAFPWPGNIRQLENVVQQAVLMSKGVHLLAEHLPACVREAALQPPACAAPGAGADGLSLGQSRDQVERAAIERALAEARQCRSQAARALGISRVTLYNKMKKYGMTTARG